MIIGSRSGGVGEHGMPTADADRQGGRASDEGLNRLNPSSLSGSAAAPLASQPTVQRTSKDRGSTRSFARSTAAAMAKVHKVPIQL